MENPVLEREERDEAPVEPAARGAERRGRRSRDPTVPDRAADWPSERRTSAANWRGPEDDEDGDRDARDAADTPTLRDHLRAQLSLTNLSRATARSSALLIDALDDDGYLTQPLEEIARAPAGGSRSRAGGAQDRALPPAELRARRRRRALARPSAWRCSSSALPDDAARALALKIVEKHLELLAARDFTAS